jgi:hypothetical protein
MGLHSDLPKGLRIEGEIGGAGFLFGKIFFAAAGITQQRA